MEVYSPDHRTLKDVSMGAEENKSIVQEFYDPVERRSDRLRASG
jgi:hypothetical protein